MKLFEQPFGWVRSILPSAENVKKEELNAGVNEKVEALMNNEHEATVKFWKEQIEKGVTGEIGDKYEFIDEELGIKNERSGKSLFITIDKNSFLLNSEPFMKVFDESFQKKDGSINIVFSKILKNPNGGNDSPAMRCPFGDFSN